MQQLARTDYVHSAPGVPFPGRNWDPSVRSSTGSWSGVRRYSTGSPFTEPRRSWPSSTDCRDGQASRGGPPSRGWRPRSPRASDQRFSFSIRARAGEPALPRDRRGARRCRPGTARSWWSRAAPSHSWAPAVARRASSCGAPETRLAFDQIEAGALLTLPDWTSLAGTWLS